jgi:crossover junction endodeoxyribonuclease RusA
MNAPARIKADRPKPRARIAAALAAQWQRPVMDEITLAIPFPPSVNDLWAPDGKGGLRKSSRYASWLVAAGTLVNTQRPGAIPGDYEMRLVLSSRRKIDLDNAVKATSDLLQANGVIANDRLAKRIVLEWSDEIDDARVTLASWGALKAREAA